MSELINVVYLTGHGEESELDEQGTRKPAPLIEKRLELRIGNIAESRADLLVSSSAAGEYSFPSGSVVGAITSYFGIEQLKYNLTALNRPTQKYYSGTWLYNRELSTHQSLLITAIPGPSAVRGSFSEGFTKHADTLLKVLRDLDQQILTDERGAQVKKIRPPISVAMPILGGNRKYDPVQRMEYIVENCAQLLKQSKYLSHIELYVYSRKEADEWSKHLEKALKRQHEGQFPFQSESVELNQLLLNRLSSFLWSTELSPHLRYEILVPMQRHLQHQGKPCIATLSTFARKSWEAVVFELSDGQSTSNHAGDLLNQFCALLNRGDLEEFTDTWVALSITKALGNAAAHFQQHELGLNKNDYPLLLLLLERFVGFVAPFEPYFEDRREDIYQIWFDKLNSELQVMQDKLQGHGLWLEPWLDQGGCKQRRKKIKNWIEQILSLNDPDHKHKYWTTTTIKERIDLPKVRKKVNDIIPESVIAHLAIWFRDDIKWAKPHSIWSELYDVLSRWRLSVFAISIIETLPNKDSN